MHSTLPVFMTLHMDDRYFNGKQKDWGEAHPLRGREPGPGSPRMGRCGLSCKPVRAARPGRQACGGGSPQQPAVRSDPPYEEAAREEPFGMGAMARQVLF